VRDLAGPCRPHLFIGNPPHCARCGELDHQGILDIEANRALRAELLERAEAHEDAVHFPPGSERFKWLLGPRDAMTWAYWELKRELLSRCELTDPVVEAAREMFRARDTHPDDIMETAVAVADEVNACGKLRDALRGLEGGDE